jgi:hypothetical protein
MHPLLCYLCNHVCQSHSWNASIVFCGTAQALQSLLGGNSSTHIGETGKIDWYDNDVAWNDLEEEDRMYACASWAKEKGFSLERPEEILRTVMWNLERNGHSFVNTFAGCVSALKHIKIMNNDFADWTRRLKTALTSEFDLVEGDLYLVGHKLTDPSMVDGMGDDLAKQEWLAQGNPQFYDGVVSFQKIFVTNSRALEVVGSYLTSQINEITLAAQDDDLKHVYVLAQNQQAMVHAAHERSKITAGNAEHLFRTRVNWATSTGARQLTWLKKPMERSHQQQCKDRIPDHVIEALQDEHKTGLDSILSLGGHVLYFRVPPTSVSDGNETRMFMKQLQDKGIFAWLAQHGLQVKPDNLPLRATMSKWQQTICDELGFAEGDTHDRFQSQMLGEKKAKTYEVAGIDLAQVDAPPGLGSPGEAQDDWMAGRTVTRYARGPGGKGGGGKGSPMDKNGQGKGSGRTPRGKGHVQTPRGPTGGYGYTAPSYGPFSPPTSYDALSPWQTSQGWSDPPPTQDNWQSQQNLQYQHEQHEYEQQQRQYLQQTEQYHQQQQQHFDLAQQRQNGPQPPQAGQQQPSWQQPTPRSQQSPWQQPSPSQGRGGGARAEISTPLCACSPSGHLIPTTQLATADTPPTTVGVNVTEARPELTRTDTGAEAETRVSVAVHHRGVAALE